MKLTARSYLFGSLALLAACSSGLEQPLPELGTLASTTSLVVPLSSNADDAEENSRGLSKSGEALDFSQDDQTVALRFANVKVPQGATIKSATISFTAISDDSAPVKLQVRAEASDNALPFGSSVKDRAKTSAADWNPKPWRRGLATRTWDLNEVVQEVVSRGGWESGNALAFYVIGDGKAERSAYARDKSSSRTPLLKITFEAPSVTSPGEAPTPSSPEVPEISSGSCLNRGSAPLMTLSSSYNKSVLIRNQSSGVRVNARNARFLNRAGLGNPSFLANYNAASFCLHGGFMDIGLSDTTDWNSFHNAAGLIFYNTPNAVIENMTINQTSDGITFKNNNPNWVFRNSYIRHAGDDGVENDRFNNGLVDDVLIDWAFTGLSCRKEQKSARDVNYNFRVQNTLIALKPQVGTYEAYQGRSNVPGHNELFKVTQNVAKGCRLILRDNVFLISGYAGKIDPSEHAGVKYDVLNRAACQGHKNTIVYTGTNRYYLKELKAAAPECFDVTTDVGVWKAARARWFDRHPEFSKYRNAEPSGASR